MNFRNPQIWGIGSLPIRRVAWTRGIEESVVNRQAD